MSLRDQLKFSDWTPPKRDPGYYHEAKSRRPETRQRDPEAMRQEFKLNSYRQRLVERSKENVQALLARAFVEEILSVHEGKISKAALKRKFKVNPDQLMERPDVIAEMKRVLSTWGGISPQERKAIAEAKKNQLLLAPETVENAELLLKTLKLLQDAELRQPVERETNVTINMPVELMQASRGLLPEAEIIDAKPLEAEKE